MNTQKDKVKIIIIAFIFFLLCIMGLYSFIYRDEINKKFQGFGKNTDPVEKHERNTMANIPKTDDKDTVKTSTIVDTNAKQTEEPEETQAKNKKPSASDYNELLKNTESGIAKDENEGNIKKKAKLTEINDDFLINENANKSMDDKPEFTGHSKKKHHKKHHKKRKHHKFKKKSSLEKRVIRLEKKLGLTGTKKTSQKSSLEKRVRRLEKIVIKKKRKRN